MRTRRNSSFGRSGLLTLGTNVLILGLNLGTGILVARTLGTGGRGQLAAILTAPQLIGWAFALGAGPAATYHLARDGGRGATLLGTWIVIVLPLGALALLFSEAVAPWLLSAQSDATLHLARLYLLSVLLAPLSDLVFGALLGDEDFAFYNLLRLATPAGIAAGYAVLQLLGSLTVPAALVLTIAVSATVTAASLWRAARKHGIGRPDIRLARQTLWYGLRVHLSSLAGIVNARLDLLLLPAFLGATSVGLYSVATNVSWIVFTLSGFLATLVLPVAARRGRDGIRTVVRSLHVTLGIGLVLAAGLAAAAGVGVSVVYGAAFLPAVPALRILLPGCMLCAASSVLTSGLAACNRPSAAALSQGVGAVATVAGLILFLERGGIVAAALVSTASYALTFVIALVLYRRATSLSWRALLPFGVIALPSSMAVAAPPAGGAR